MPKRQVKDKTITLSPVKFEDALTAALETPPERKPKPKKKTKPTAPKR
jgi:hypothetical protein